MEPGQITQFKQFATSLIEFTEHDLALALPYFKVRTFAAKEIIFSAGDMVNDVFFLLSGIGRYYYIDERGYERNKSLVKCGGAFTSMSSLVEKRPSPFFTQAIVPCNTLSVSYDDLLTLAKRNTQWAMFLLKVYERLVLKKEKREADLLLLSGQQRYQQFLREFSDEAPHIPLRQVAMYIGVTDVSLSRIRKVMGLT